MPGKTRKIALIAIAALALAVPASAQACTSDGKLPASLTVYEARAAALCVINQYRAAHGVGALSWDRRLERAAQKHSGSMNKRNFFAHVSPGGSSAQSRIRRTGYFSGASAWGFGENIAWGAAARGSAKSAVAHWMASPSHRTVMLSGRYHQVGIGVALGSPTRGRGRNTAIYTASFGFRH